MSHCGLCAAPFHAAAMSSPAAAAALPCELLQGALFDIDGTLADTDATHRAVFRDLLAPEGIVVTEEYFATHISGRANAALVAALFPHYTAEQQEAWAVRKEAMFRERAAASLRPLEGIIELLSALRSRGVKLAAVTNAPRLNVEMILETIFHPKSHTHYFDAIVLGEECSQAKPHPEPYREAMRRLGAMGAAGTAGAPLDPRRCVVFEDSPTGVTAGAAADVLTIGLLTSQSPAALRKAGAHFSFPNFAHLTPDAIEDMLRARNGAHVTRPTAAVAAVGAASSSASASSTAPAAATAAPLSIALSTHVLNTSNGLPASDMLVTLQQLRSTSGSASASEGDWVTLASDRTNSDGRIGSFPALTLSAGVDSSDYRLLFSASEYFESLQIRPAFFPQIALQFRVDRARDADRKKLHVPLLLSPFGYSTYRGS